MNPIELGCERQPATVTSLKGYHYLRTIKIRLWNNRPVTQLINSALFKMATKITRITPFTRLKHHYMHHNDAVFSVIDYGFQNTQNIYLNFFTYLYINYLFRPNKNSIKWEWKITKQKFCVNFLFLTKPGFCYKFK